MIFLVFFTDGAPLDRLGLPYENSQTPGHPAMRYLVCRSVSGTDLGFLRCLPMEQAGAAQRSYHLPREWVMCIAEGETPQAFGFLPPPAMQSQ